MSAVTLKLGGSEYSGWKGIDIRIGIEQMAGAFQLRCADRWAINGQALPLLPGAAAAVLIDRQPVITGYIDEIAPAYSASEHSLAITGRDATGDLVDSSAVTDGGGWKDRSLRQIASALAAQHGISVTVDGTPEADIPFKYAHLNCGETVHSALSRLARLRAYLLVSDGLGNLHITRAGAGRASTALVLGGNVLGANASISHAERFRTYRVLAQGRESDNVNGEQAQQVLAEETDPQIRKSRITIIDTLEAADTADAKRLAAWARSSRAAAGWRATYRVRGWLDGSRPWRPNTLVSVQDSLARFTGTYLINALNFRLDEEGGEITDISVAPPEAYKLIPLKEQSPTGSAQYQLGGTLPGAGTPQLGAP